MYPYFKRDMDAGLYDENGALELLDEFFLIFNRDSDLYPLSLIHIEMCIRDRYQGGRVLARRYYEAVKKYLDGDQIIQIRTQLGF